MNFVVEQKKRIKLHGPNRNETTLNGQLFQKRQNRPKELKEILNEISADHKTIWAIHNMVQMIGHSAIALWNVPVFRRIILCTRDDERRGSNDKEKSEMRKPKWETV